MNTNDPLEAADVATLAPREYFGQVLVDSYFCALVKGVGKVPFDPAQHQKRFTAIKIDLVPLSEMNVTNPIAREMIAESREWVNFTLASLRDLNVKTADIRNRYAKITFVPTGEHYKNSAGEDKEKTALKFVAVYPDESACRAAYQAENGNGTAHTVDLNPAAPTGNGKAVDAGTRSKLFPFVNMILKKAVELHPSDIIAAGDEAAVRIAEHGTLRNFFTITDEDVMLKLNELCAAPLPN